MSLGPFVLLVLLLVCSLICRHRCFAVTRWLCLVVCVGVLVFRHNPSPPVAAKQFLLENISAQAPGRVFSTSFSLVLQTNKCFFNPKVAVPLDLLSIYTKPLVFH